MRGSGQRVAKPAALGASSGKQTASSTCVYADRLIATLKPTAPRGHEPTASCAEASKADGASGERPGLCGMPRQVMSGLGFRV
jgi:hypothetical protein